MPATPDQRGKAPYRQLAESLQRFIEEGTLRPGGKLPSVRLMAKRQGLSPRTVVKSYGLLEDLGQVEGRSRSGFYVRPQLAMPSPLPEMARPMAQPGYVGVSDLAADVMKHSTDLGGVALGWGSPDGSLFPNRRIARMLSSIIRDEPAWLARASLNWGYEPLTREIARRYVLDGIKISHSEVMITSGCTEALNLSIRAVAKPGDTVAVETPAAFALLQTLQSLGVRVLEIPACPTHGIQLGNLRAALLDHKIAAVIAMPNFQNPLGCTLSDEVKTRLYELLREFDLPAVEDDVYGELFCGDRRPKPLKSWDADGRVLLCSSFSKTLAPGLRVGWCAPGRYLEPVRRLKMANTMGTPLVLQKLMCDFLRMGGYDHHLRGLRRAYHRQVELFTERIRRDFPPGTAVSRPKGGYILWIQFPKKVDSVKLYHEAVKRNISIAPGILFSSQPRYSNCIRINASAPWSAHVQSALSVLGNLASAQLPGYTGQSLFRRLSAVAV